LRTDLLLAAVLAAMAAGSGAHAQQPPPVAEVEMLDPWVPPEVRAKAKAAVAAPTRGAALDAQVEAKLRRRFEEAAGPGGMLTREQARARGLGGIAERFEAIDRGGRGAISFDDYRAYLRAAR